MTDVRASTAGTLPPPPSPFGPPDSLWSLMIEEVRRREKFEPFECASAFRPSVSNLQQMSAPPSHRMGTPALQVKREEAEKKKSKDKSLLNAGACA